MSRIVTIDPAAVAAHSRTLLFTPEPGACGGRLHPGQTLLPPWIAQQLDRHVWPGLAPNATTAQARAVCEHIDWENIWRREPALWARAHIRGAPTPETLWHTRAELAQHGYRLCLDVELHAIDGQIALLVYGAGVLGRLTDRAWDIAAPLLTSCACIVREPREDTANAGWLRPARPPTSQRQRPLPTGVTLPANGWQSGDWMHTWWSYLDGPLATHCPCPAHAAAGPDFGPGTHRPHHPKPPQPQREDGAITT
jgi:hypothetical protein